jgi:hypothetical protein
MLGPLCLLFVWFQTREMLLRKGRKDNRKEMRTDGWEGGCKEGRE